MIYKVQTHNYNNTQASTLSLPKEGYLSFSDREIALIESLRPNDHTLQEYALLIPRDWARGESKLYLGNQERVKDVPHYELYIEKQMGSWKSRKDSYIFLKLPKSEMIINIVLHPDGGVSFDKKFHKYVIREMDELDRRIILGFCDKYHDALIKAIHSESEEPDNWLSHIAATYKATDYKKRIKSGSRGKDLTDFHRKYNGGFDLLDESALFKNVVFV